MLQPFDKDKSSTCIHCRRD